MDQKQYERLIKENPSLAKCFEYNRGSWRNGPYWRRKPYYRDQPTRAQKKHRVAFTSSAMSAYGKKGLTNVNGIMMPQASKKVHQELSGKRFAEITTEEKRFQSTKKKAQDMLLQVTNPSFLEMLDAIAKFIEKRQAIKNSQG